jgi:hypothetical protein
MAGWWCMLCKASRAQFLDKDIEKWIINDLVSCGINSFTAKSVLVGTKNSHSEGFWQAKHNHTNIPTMMEQFAPPAAWFC